jgi:hypothetical protein
MGGNIIINSLEAQAMVWDLLAMLVGLGSKLRFDGV